jgi:hypothetical protein
VAWVRDRTVPTDRPPLGEVSAKFADRVCHVVSVTDPYGRILGFLDRSRYFFFEVAPQLYSRGWVDPVPDPLLLRKSGRAGRLTTSAPSVSRLYIHCGILDNLQPYRPPRPVIGMAFQRCGHCCDLHIELSYLYTVRNIHSSFVVWLW